jgi:hypothetical protein
MDTLTLRRDEDPEPKETFLDRYSQWAATRTDAPVQYHITTAVVILSAIMAPHAVLPTSFAEIRPNIWAMILAGTTTTRKSTSMDMALRVLDDVHPDYLMATDGSPEGLLSELSYRDGKVSLFHRDEITGFIDSARTKEYLAGLLESMTRLYDGRREKRILRRDTIEVKDPRFIILCGGIQSKMQQIVSVEHIQSGFIPRFLIVSGSTTSDQMRPIGPPPNSREGGYDPREDILKELFDIGAFWMPTKKVEVKNVGPLKKKVAKSDVKMEMSATPEAWARIRQLQNDATKLGEKSVSPDVYTPIYARLADSVIKIAMLLTGADQRTVIEYQDVCQAISYSDMWLNSAQEFARGVEEQPDFNPWERKLKKIITYITQRHKDGEITSRANVMRRFHVKGGRDIENIETTLKERGMIITQSQVLGKKADGRSSRKPTLTYIPTERALGASSPNPRQVGDDNDDDG